VATAGKGRAGKEEQKPSQARAVLAHSRELALAVRDGTTKLDEALKEVKAAREVIDPQDRDLVQTCRLLKRSLNDRLRHLILAGQGLRIKKASLPHDEWLPWLKANAEALNFESPRTAERLLEIGKYDASVEYDVDEAMELLHQFNRQ
jgi:hypothetical protein